ncbi:ABC transporter ATP-binding protein [Acidobacteria bacterium Mor1]|nr:ABC transporter ATP-binding protein [Acidobacteria bacterium Mor1]
MSDPGAQRLEADNLCVNRGGKSVLEDLSFSVASREVYALLGGNGAGKSTTLLVFLGFLPVARGEARVSGKTASAHPNEVRRCAAYLPESVSLYPHLTARENLDYFLKLAGIAPQATAVESALDRVGLQSSVRDMRMGSFSKGMRQKVAIALALLRDTEILLLDEPTSGLDPRGIDEFHGLIRGLSDAGKTVLMVTHDVYGACQVADRIGLLRDRKLVAEFEAPSGGRIDTETVHRAFGGGSL